MKRPIWKRIGLSLLQHIIAMGVFVTIATILFNSYLSVGSMNGIETYYLDPLGAPAEFEDSEVFHKIFQTAISDITRLVVIKGQMETDGKFDSRKHIDVTRFANRKGTGNGCNTTAVYELDDLIKWGKSGVEYANRAMSMTDFISYYGDYIDPANFALDENGNLYFIGFVQKAAPEKPAPEEGEVQETETILEETDAERLLIADVMQFYAREQLEDMIFAYILPRTSGEITAVIEDDGRTTVHIRMLTNRYRPIEGENPLYTYAANWVEYIQLQQNVVAAVTSLSENFEQYNNCNNLYEEGKSNIKYAVCMMTTEGFQTYSNVPEVAFFDESGITDYFSEFRRYLIYYPDSLEFIGNTSITEADIYALLSEYEYAFPETTHIWIGVDTDYAVEGDAFEHAASIHNKIVPYIRLIFLLLAVLFIVWAGIGMYLTVTAGVAVEENGEKAYYLERFDYIWLEIIVLFIVGFAFAGYLGGIRLMRIADGIYEGYEQLSGTGADLLYGYSFYGAYGFCASLSFTVFWYSLARRVKTGMLWRNTFVYWLFCKVAEIVSFIFHHKNSVISTLLPYYLYLLTNGITFFAILQLIDMPALRGIVGAGLAIFDMVVGLLLFKRSGEQVDIVEGICKIRDGEVDYKLNTDKLHGPNKEMADAVNNIGEGIRNAVKTSMKDEQMKTDLITNVSHDIKTPLTSIISYVDLLKRVGITEEPAKGYIDILESKSQRLKQLTDDLVEASKISSGNIELQLERLNLTELLQQAIGEFSEKLEENRLTVVFEGSHLRADITADSRRLWRVVENLFNNICKYALEGTRIYVDLTIEEGEVALCVKNISKGQMNINAEELTERFIRGDSSRTTEGSGLGLSIAKSLTQAQGGSFELFLDGDLFKTVLKFPLAEPEQEPQTSSMSTSERLL